MRHPTGGAAAEVLRPMRGKSLASVFPRTPKLSPGRSALLYDSRMPPVPPERPAEPLSFDDEATIVWSPPDWDPEDDSRTEARVRSSQGSMPDTARPAVEVEERRISIQAVRQADLAYEVWTRNRVYNIDATMTCIDVIDLTTGKSNPDHPFIGARLSGGQRRSGDASELSLPLPAPGSDAVFQKRDHTGIRLAVTSAVTRVILHLHRVAVKGPERDRAWGKITRPGP